MTDVGAAKVSVEGDVRDFARQTERDLDKQLAKINLDPVKVETEIDDASIAKTTAKAKAVGDAIGKTVNKSLQDVGLDPIDIKANPAEALAAIKVTEEKLKAISDDAATVEIRVKTEKALSDLTSFRKLIGESGKQAGHDLGDGVAGGVDEKHGVISGALKKAFTPNAGMFDALKAPFAAAMSTPIVGAVIVVAGLAALAFVGAFAAAIATAGLGAVFLGIGATALFGAKADREKAEKDLTKAEEKVRKAELAAQSGTAASKRSLAEAMTQLAKAQEVVGKNAAFVKLDSSLKNLGDTLKRVGQEAAQPLMAPLTKALDSLSRGAEVIGPLLKEVFFQLAPAIEPLTDSIVSFVREFLKILTADPKTLEGMRDSLIALADNMPRLAIALGELFALFASNENNVRNIGMLFDILVWAVNTLGVSIFVLSSIFDGLVIAWNAVGDAISVVIGFFKAIPGTLTPVRSAVIGFFSSLWSSVTGFFSSIGSSIGGFFSSLWTSIAGFFTALPGKIMEALAAALVAVQTFLSVTIPGLLGDLGYAIGYALGTYVAFFAALPGRIVDALVALPGLIAGVWTTVWATVTAVVSSGVSAVVDFFTKLPERARNAMSSLVSVVSSVFSSAGTSAQNKATDLVNGAINVIKGLPGRIQSALNSVRSTVINAFSGAGSWLYNAGQNIVYGIGNGIWSALQWAVNAAWNAARRIVQGFMDALRIGSPSKVAEDKIGEPLMAGVAVGVRDNVDLVEKQINDMVSRSFGVDLPAFTVPATAATRGSDGAALGATTGATPQINVQVFVGDKEIKDTIRVAINEHDRSLGGQVSSGTGGFRL